MAFDLSEENPLERIKKFMVFINEKNEERPLFTDPFVNQVTPVSCTIQRDPNGRPTAATTTFTFTVQPNMLNGMGNLHGGASATLIDFLTTTAIAPLASKGKFEYGGVSRTLSVGYLKPTKNGEEVEVVCECVNVGRRLAAIRCVLRRESDGEVLVTGEHHKASIDDQFAAKL